MVWAASSGFGVGSKACKHSAFLSKLKVDSSYLALTDPEGRETPSEASPSEARCSSDRTQEILRDRKPTLPRASQGV